jgi:hypothetical protein
MTKIAVIVTCSDPGMKFAGTIVTDGHSKRLSGIGTSTFHATGHEFVCSFKKTGADGLISVSVTEAGNNLGNAYTAGQFGGVRAEVVRTSAAPRNTFTTFDEVIVGHTGASAPK